MKNVTHRKNQTSAKVGIYTRKDFNNLLNIKLAVPHYSVLIDLLKNVLTNISSRYFFARKNILLKKKQFFRVIETLIHVEVSIASFLNSLGLW